MLAWTKPCGVEGCMCHEMSDGIPRPIDKVDTVPTVSVTPLTNDELAAIYFANTVDETPCANCGSPMSAHPVPFGRIFAPYTRQECVSGETHPIGGWECESYVDPDYNLYSDNEDE